MSLIDRLSPDIIREIEGVFPFCHVEIEDVPDGDSPNARCVVVYGVEQAEARQVRSLINDLDWDLFRESEYTLIPRIVNIANTERFYPEHLCHPERYGTPADVPMRTVRSNYSLPFDEIEAHPVATVDAANTELLLAA